MKNNTADESDHPTRALSGAERRLWGFLCRGEQAQEHFYDTSVRPARLFFTYLMDSRMSKSTMEPIKETKK